MSKPDRRRASDSFRRPALCCGIIRTGDRWKLKHGFVLYLSYRTDQTARIDQITAIVERE